jgi:KipI family sensor histidine kinase inhibitor
VTGGPPRIEAFGESALLVTFGEEIDRGLNRRARALAFAVDALRVGDARFRRAVAAYASVLVPFDALAIDLEEARSAVADLLAGLDAAPAEPATSEYRLVEIPVAYGGDDGPDLDDVAALHELRPADVVELHANREYEVFFLGFAPGFAYLGTLPERLVMPRLATPRVRVPAGSVGIAGAQTGVYPFAMPGGWRLIGRTHAPMWDLTRDSPALLRPGDRVRFVPTNSP